MNRIVDKFPYKKSLYLQWFEAAIGNLILFKHLKDKFNNNIYFLISDQGILLKATTSNYLKNAQEEITKFYTAKMEMLDTTASSDFYEKILEDIREETDKLKDSRDCPYINLVYSEKLKHSCIALKKFGYVKPYETWEITEREKRGFCYLIVRPEHRWKEIANNVMALIKKRQNVSHKNEVQCNWPVEMSYEDFIWLYLRKEFSNFKKDLEIKEKKGQAAVVVTFKKNITEFMDLEKIINILQCSYSEERPLWKEKEESNGSKKICKPIILSTLQLEKVTQLIYHEYGLPNLVRQIRGKNQKYLTICPSEEITLDSFNEDSSLASNLLMNYKSKLILREDICRVKEEQITEVLRLGKRHKIVNYRGTNFIMAKYQLPLHSNIENVLKYRLPSLPLYIYAYQKKQELYLMRHYEIVNLKNALQTESLTNQIFLMNSAILIIQQLHKRDIFVGSGFINNLFVNKLRIIVEPSEAGSKQEDNSKLILLVREWVKNMKECDIKTELQKINDPIEMLPLFDNYLSDNFI